MAAHSSAVSPRVCPRRAAADFGAAEVFEGLVSERPGGRLLTGVAGGPAGGGDGHRGGCLRAAGRPKMADVGGDARVIERAAVEPGGELAVCRGG